MGESTNNDPNLSIKLLVLVVFQCSLILPIVHYKSILRSYKSPGLHVISAHSDPFPNPTTSALLIFLMNISSDHILPFNFMVSDPQFSVWTLSSSWCMPGFISNALFIALVIYCSCNWKKKLLWKAFMKYAFHFPMHILQFEECSISSHYGTKNVNLEIHIMIFFLVLFLMQIRNRPMWFWNHMQLNLAKKEDILSSLWKQRKVVPWYNP